jgi:hypothetical protein
MRFEAKLLTVLTSSAMCSFTDVNCGKQCRFRRAIQYSIKFLTILYTVLQRSCKSILQPLPPSELRFDPRTETTWHEYKTRRGVNAKMAFEAILDLPTPA